MAEVTGVVGLPVAYVPPVFSLSPQLDQFTAPLKADEVTNSPGGVGPLQSNFPIQERAEPVLGFVGPSFGGDYFNRIHIIPGKINVGNLLSAQSRTFEVWNSHRTPKLLSEVGEIGSDGLNLVQSESPPSTFGIFEARVYLLQVSTQGSPVIDATYLFDFGTETPALEVTGRRVMVWPFIPQTVHKEVLEWKTDITPSFNTEQRLALRTAPRQFFNYTCHLTQYEFSKAKAIATQWAHRVYGVPVWAELTRLGSLSPGATFLSFDTSNADYRENDVILLWESNERQVAVEITTVEAGGLNLKIPLEMSFEIAYVMPLRFARAPEGISFTRGGNVHTTANCNFQVTRNKDLGSSIGYPTYRGKDVVIDRTIVVGDIKERIFRSVDTFDNGSGVVDIDVSSNKLDFHQVLTISTRNRTERWKARQWLHRLRGKQKTFWLVSWNRDLEVVIDFTSTATGLTVKSINYALLYGVKDIMIQFKDGTRVFKRILSGTANPDGTENINFDSPVGVTSTAENVDFISFMSHVRLDTDAVEISHTYDGQTEINIPVVEIPE